MDSVKNYFKDFPASKKCFTTADGLVFHEQGDANLHAASLDDKEVVPHDAAKYAKPAKEEKAAKKEAGEKVDAAKKEAGEKADAAKK